MHILRRNINYSRLLYCKWFLRKLLQRALFYYLICFFILIKKPSLPPISPPASSIKTTFSNLVHLRLHQNACTDRSTLALCLTSFESMIGQLSSSAPNALFFLEVRSSLRSSFKVHLKQLIIFNNASCCLQA